MYRCRCRLNSSSSMSYLIRAIISEIDAILKRQRLWYQPKFLKWRVLCRTTRYMRITNKCISFSKWWTAHHTRPMYIYTCHYDLNPFESNQNYIIYIYTPKDLGLQSHCVCVSRHSRLSAQETPTTDWFELRNYKLQLNARRRLPE